MLWEKRGNTALPLLLIALGVVILAVRVGVLSWAGLLGLLQLWPLLLIALGVDILLRGRYRLAVLVAALALGGLIWSGRMNLRGFGGIAAETHVIEQPLGDAERAEIHLSVGVSELRLQSLQGSSNLIEGTVETGRGERLLQAAKRRGGVLVVDLESKQRGGVMFGFREKRLWDLALSPDVPLALELEAGVGRSELDLMDLKVSDFTLDAGVGDVRVTLPRRGRYRATFDNGVGATVIRVPEGLAARIEVSTGVGAVTVHGDYTREEGVYLSADYATAENRVDLRVDGGVGAITIEQGPREADGLQREGLTGSGVCIGFVEDEAAAVRAEGLIGIDLSTRDAEPVYGIGLEARADVGVAGNEGLGGLGL